jgi:hypothetical protein
VTVLLLDAAAQRPAWADEADHVIHELGQLLPLLGIDRGPPGEPT